MAYQGALLSQQAVQSYANLLTGPAAGQFGDQPPRAADDASPADQPRSVLISIPQTVLLTATVTDTVAAACAADRGGHRHAVHAAWCRCLSGRRGTSRRRSGRRS